MGLGKMMGLGKKGKIHVNTEKPTYYPGEVSEHFYLNQLFLFSGSPLIFSIYVFLRRSRKKNKYRRFKVERFGGGGGW